MRRIGIIAGVADELAAFRPDRPGTTGRLGNLPIRHVDHGGKEVLLACAGVGKVAATTAAALLHAHGGVELLVVIGTAGKLSAIDGHLFQVNEAIQGDYGAMRDSGFVHYTAGTLPIGPAVPQSFICPVLPDIGLPRARITTGDMFVESAGHAARLREGLSADLVDMETAAVAQAATLLGLPWSAVKATTDGADDESAGSFAANLAAAARMSAEAAERLIAGL